MIQDDAVAAAQHPAKRVTLFGMRFDAFRFDEAVERLAALARCATGAYAVTANVDHVVRFQRQPELRRLYEEADLLLADGMPLVWASRRLGAPLPARVAGSDLFPALCARAARDGLSVYFMGGAPGTADRCAELLKERHPHLRVGGTCCPPMGFEKDAAENARIVAAINDARPDILFVGLGSPKQEQWIAGHRAACGARLSIGIGISFSFLCGDVRRAPRWVQRIGLEWAHRLVQEPRRLWRRYLIEDRAFAGMVWREWRRRDTAASSPTKS